MGDAAKCLCCAESGEAMEKWGEEGYSCITGHPGFEPVCLKRHTHIGKHTDQSMMSSGEKHFLIKWWWRWFVLGTGNIQFHASTSVYVYLNAT